MFSLLISACIIFVYYDATKNKIGKISSEKGFLNMKAGWWAVFTMLLWIVGFPLYLIKRKKLLEKADKNPVEPSSWRKIWLGLFILIFLLNLAVIILAPMFLKYVATKYIAPGMEAQMETMIKSIPHEPTAKMDVTKKATVAKKMPVPKKSVPVKVVSKKALPVKAQVTKKSAATSRTTSVAERSREVAKDIRILKTGSKWIYRNEAARRLAGVKEDVVILALILSLTEDPDPFVRREAALSLGKSGDSRAVAPLTAALEDNDSWVREFASGALERLK